jgi:hypothetical protein
MWMVCTALAYMLVFLLFDMQPLGPWTRRIGIALSMFALTVQIIRTEMTDIRLVPFWGDTPLAQSMGITLFLAIMADMGLPYLITVGMGIILMDVTWIADNWQRLGGLFF